MSALTPIREYVDGLVHESVRHDRLAVIRHRAFISPRIVGALLALAALPIYLAVAGLPGPIEMMVFGWFLAPIGVAFYLSRTGKYENAHLLSCVALAGLITFVSLQTGGVSSFAALWLILVPIEATLSGSRRVIVIAALLAIVAAFLLLVTGDASAPVPAASSPERVTALATLGLVSATLYAAGIALNTDAFARVLTTLRRSDEARYHLLARHMTDLITRHGKNGAVMFASPASERLIGCEPGALLGHGLFDRVHVADRPAYRQALAAASTAGDERSVEFRLRRDQQNGQEGAGHFVWVEMRCRAFRGSVAEPIDGEREIVAVIRDISERKRQQRDLEQAMQDIERANAAKGRFLAIMSHELRTPLNVIIGFSEMLMDEKLMRVSKSSSSEYARLIHDSGTHLLSVVNLVLDMSKLESGSFQIVAEPFSPGPIITSCCDLLAFKAREGGIDLSVSIPRDLPEIVADKRALKQILLNLLSNAIKFTKPQGKVAVTAEIEGGQFVLRVIDTGVGIPSKDIDRLGDPFFQVQGSYDRPTEGTGLGLSIVKGLVALHGGRLLMRSRLGEGTCMTIELPRDGQRSGAGETVKLAPAAPVEPEAQKPIRLQVRKSA